MAKESFDLKKNGIGAWYDYLEEFGERSDITLGKLNPELLQPLWQVYPHQKFDGLGALIKTLTQAGIFTGDIPLAQTEVAKKRISLKALYLMFTFPPRRIVKWKHFDRAWPTNSAHRVQDYAKAWVILDEYETRRLKKKAKEENASLNSLLALTLTRALLPIITEGEEKALWMMPVNLRGHVQANEPTDNQSSLLPIWVDPRASIRSVHGHIESQKKTGFHWVAWLTGRFAPLLSAKNSRAKVRRDWLRPGHPWLGVFSNLGNFHPKSLDQGNWLFFPTVTKVRPLGVGCLGWGNTLALCIQAHPALTEDANEVQTWVQAWQQELKSC